MRRYGKWAGNPDGTPEDTARCAAQILNTGEFIFRQCSRKRGNGPGGEYCTQHAKLLRRGSTVSIPPEERA